MSRLGRFLDRRGEVRLVDFLATIALGVMLGTVTTLGVLDGLGMLK